MKTKKSKSRLLTVLYKSRFLDKMTILYKRTYLKYMLFRGFLVEVDNSHRGLGKTEMLLNKAEHKDIPILVGFTEIKKQYEYRKPTVTVYSVNKSNLHMLQGTRFRNGVLIDESVPKDVTEFIQCAYPCSIEIKGGHIPNYGGKK